jgi:N-acetylglucosamine-6-phosphate deacetylase
MTAVESAMKEQSAPSGAGRAKGTGGAAAILGVHLEGPFLNTAQCGALDPASFLEPEERAFRRLVEGFEGIVRIVTVAPEMKGASELIRMMTAAGIAVNMGHSNATYAEAEAGFRAGARGITHLFNGMRPFHHREPGIMGFALNNREIYVEVIGDLVHSNIHALELVFRMKTPDRVILVSDSVRETGVSQGAEPRDGEGRLLGGSFSLSSVLRMLIQAGFDAESVTRAATENPKRYLRS